MLSVSEIQRNTQQVCFSADSFAFVLISAWEADSSSVWESVSPPHPLYRLLAECRDRGVTINSTCFFLSALVIVGHMVMMWKGESG